MLNYRGIKSHILNQCRKMTKTFHIFNIEKKYKKDIIEVRKLSWK